MELSQPLSPLGVSTSYDKEFAGQRTEGHCPWGFPASSAAGDAEGFTSASSRSGKSLHNGHMTSRGPLRSNSQDSHSLSIWLATLMVHSVLTYKMQFKITEGLRRMIHEYKQAGI